MHDIRKLLITCFEESRVEAASDADLVSEVCMVINLMSRKIVAQQKMPPGTNAFDEAKITFFCSTGDMKRFEEELFFCLSSSQSDMKRVFRISCLTVYAHNNCLIDSNRFFIRTTFYTTLEKLFSKDEIDSLSRHLTERKIEFYTEF